MKNHYLNFVSKKTVEIGEEEIPLESIGEQEIAGRTVYSMISAGTEINSVFLDVFHWGYPSRAGYTVVFQVEHKGSSVQGIEIGDLVFCMAPHQSYQKINYQAAIKLPEGLTPEKALFARLAGVSMATLSRTAVTPGEKILVTGLGTVGFMAMNVYSHLGYEMIGVDPEESRRETIRQFGFSEVYPAVPFDRYSKQIGLALECSGNEAAVLDCCNIVRPHGEVSLVGVPWKPYTDITAYRLLHSMFYNYVRVYSGWEMDLPQENSMFIHESQNKNYRLAMEMIRSGKIALDERVYAIKPYTQAQQAYSDIYEKKESKIATIFSWD